MGLNKSDFKSPSEVKEQRSNFETPADSIILKKPDFQNFLSRCDKLRVVKLKQNAEL